MDRARGTTRAGKVIIVSNEFALSITAALIVVVVADPRHPLDGADRGPAHQPLPARTAASPGRRASRRTTTSTGAGRPARGQRARTTLDDDGPSRPERAGTHRRRRAHRGRAARAASTSGGRPATQFGRVPPSARAVTSPRRPLEEGALGRAARPVERPPVGRRRPPTSAPAGAAGRPARRAGTGSRRGCRRPPSASIIARPVAGPSAIATATARLSSTTGDGSCRRSASYRTAICGQSVSAADRRLVVQRRRWPPGAGTGPGRPRRSARSTRAWPSPIARRRPSAPDPGPRAGRARRPARPAPRAGRRGGASGRAGPRPRARRAGAARPAGPGGSPRAVSSRRMSASPDWTRRSPR